MRPIDQSGWGSIIQNWLWFFACTFVFVWWSEGSTSEWLSKLLLPIDNTDNPADWLAPRVRSFSISVLLSLSIVFSYRARMLNLGSGAFVVLAVYVLASIAGSASPLSGPEGTLALVLAVSICFFLGAAFGILHVRKVCPLVLSTVLLTAGAVELLDGWSISNVNTGSLSTLINRTDNFWSGSGQGIWKLNENTSLFFLAGASIAAVAIAQFSLTRTRFGLEWCALRGGVELSRYFGIRTWAIAALGGGMSAVIASAAILPATCCASAAAEGQMIQSNIMGDSNVLFQFVQLLLAGLTAAVLGGMHPVGILASSVLVALVRVGWVPLIPDVPIGISGGLVTEIITIFGIILARQRNFAGNHICKHLKENIFPRETQFSLDRSACSASNLTVNFPPTPKKN